jgi:micrococcal nuclease
MTTAYSPYWYNAKVLRTVDGDTIDLMVDLGFDVHHKIRVRLFGVNTPETRTKDVVEKEMGLKAKAFTHDWLEGHPEVFVQTVADKNEKYGRVLANIYSGNLVDDPSTACLNKDIIGAGYAREYFGIGDKTWNEYKKK